MSERPELEHVPTCAELVKSKLATVIAANKQGVPTTVRISNEGHQLLGEIMRRNGLAMRAYDEANPSRMTLLRREQEAARDRARSWAEDAFAE